MLILRQSSPSGAVKLNGVFVGLNSGRDGHDRPNAFAVIGFFWFGSLTGGANRRGPVGGFAYGMPRYSWTAGFRRPLRPMIVPNGAVTVGVAGAGSAKAAERQRERDRRTQERNIRSEGIVMMFYVVSWGLVPIPGPVAIGEPSYDTG